MLRGVISRHHYPPRPSTPGFPQRPQPLICKALGGHAPTVAHINQLLRDAYLDPSAFNPQMLLHTHLGLRAVPAPTLAPQPFLG